MARRAHGPEAADDPGFEPGPDDVVTQLYTSGTTGLPKGVMISGRNIATILRRGRPGLPASGRTPCRMVAMPLFHIGGHRVGAGRACPGAATRSSCGTSTRPRSCRLIEQHRITDTFFVPAVLMFLLATPELADTDVSSLRTVFYGASPISEDVLVRSMEALGCDFAQVYGLTETTGAITSLLPEDHDPDGPRAACCARPAGPSTTWSCGSSTRPPARSCRSGRWARCGPGRTRTCSATGTSPTRRPRSSSRTVGSAPGTPDG